MAKRSADLRQAMLNRTRPAPPRSVASDSAATEHRGPHFRPGRVGKSNVTGYFPPEVKKQLRILAAEQETTIQNLLATALNDLFAKHGRPEIAPITEHARQSYG